MSKVYKGRNGWEKHADGTWKKVGVTASNFDAKTAAQKLREVMKRSGPSYRNRDFDLLKKKISVAQAAEVAAAYNRLIEAEAATDAAKSKPRKFSITFADARRQILNTLERSGWKGGGGAKVPSVSKGSVHLYFRPQAIYYAIGGGESRSLHIEMRDTPRVLQAIQELEEGRS